MEDFFIKTNLTKSLLIIIILIMLIAGVLIYNSYFAIKKNKSDQNFVDCGIIEQLLKVSGASLSGFVENGAEMKALMGYYGCNPVERNDLVLYGYSGGEDPLIKIAKGIPGDKFHLEKSSADCWNVLINGEIIKNSENQEYCFSENGYKMLSLYEKDYNGIIPENAYLIFGNLTGGSLDSSRFGLIGKTDLIGKAEVDN